MKKHNTLKVVLITTGILFLCTWIFKTASLTGTGYEAGERMQMGVFDLFNYQITSMQYFGYIALFVLVVGAFYGVLHETGAYRNMLDKIASKFKRKDIGLVEGIVAIVLLSVFAFLLILASGNGLLNLFSGNAAAKYAKTALTMAGSTKFIIGLISYIVVAVLGCLFYGLNKKGKIITACIAALAFIINLILGLPLPLLVFVPVISTAIVYLVSMLKGDNARLVFIMIALAALVSFAGIQLPLIALIPFLVSLILLMGYDKVTAALTIVGSMMVGIAGTTYAYNTTSILNQALVINNSNSIWIKLLILVIGLVLLAFNTFMYINKKDTKRNELKADKEEYVPEESGSKRSFVPIAIICGIIFVVMLLSLIPWSGAFGITAFDKATEAVTKFSIGGFPLFAKLLGTFNAFGNWSLIEIGVLLIIMSLVIKFIYMIKFDNYLDAAIRGIRKALLPALLVILIYAILVLVTYHPFQLAIFNALLGEKFNVFASGLSAILSSLINVESAYVFQTTVPVIATQADVNKSLVYVMFQSIYGVIMLIAPTSLILMGVLAYLKIPYGKWFKTIWKLVLELLVILFIIFLIMN